MIAEQTYSISKGVADNAISSAAPGSDLTQAKQSLENAEAKTAQAKTIPDYYNPTDGPIYWAQLAAQQAIAASLAKTASQAGQQSAAEVEKQVQLGSAQIANLMRNYLLSQGYNPADYKIGIQKISSQDINWATGAATPLAPAPGSQDISFLFQNENGNWVLRAAPSWTQGQFGAPADMVP